MTPPILHAQYGFLYLSSVDNVYQCHRWVQIHHNFNDRIDVWCWVDALKARSAAGFCWAYSCALTYEVA